MTGPILLLLRNKWYVILNILINASDLLTSLRQSRINIAYGINVYYRTGSMKILSDDVDNIPEITNTE